MRIREMVLLVEDHAASREAMVRLLRHRGIEAITARTAEEAIMLVGDFEFEVLISDLGLPDQSGLDLMAYVKEHHPALPGIAVSARSSPEDRAASKAAGFSIHLAKPLQIDELMTALARIKELPA